MRPIFIIFFGLFGLSLQAQSVDSLGLINFQDAVLEFQNSPINKNAIVAISVSDTRDGTVVFGFNQEKSLPSASILKLVTSATALELLGASYQFKTFFEYSGEIQNDTLFGDIYIRGTGDPSFGSSRFKAKQSELNVGIKEALLKLKVKHIAGNVLVDGQFFNGNAVANTWLYEDLGMGYGTGVYAVNFNENQLKISLKAGVNGSDSIEVVSVEPSIPAIEIQNQLKIASKDVKSRYDIYRTSKSNLSLQGNIQSRKSIFSVYAAMGEPELFAKEWFYEVLSSDSITILPTENIRAHATERKIFYVFNSPILKDLIQETNHWSLNLYADSFLRIIGKTVHQDASFESGVETMTAHWQKKIPDLSGFRVKDGSGLSATGSLTTGNMTQILNKVALEPYFRVYSETMAVLGQHGTLKGLGGKSKERHHIRAKSGTLDGTRAYAGYAQAKSGRLLSFAFIVHKFDPNQKDLVGRQLVDLMLLLTAL